MQEGGGGYGEAGRERYGVCAEDGGGDAGQFREEGCGSGAGDAGEEVGRFAEGEGAAFGGEDVFV